MLETVEDIGTEAFVEVLVLLVRNVLDEDRGVEIDEGAFHATGTVAGEVDRREGTIRTVALADHCHTSPTTTVRIEPIRLLACRLVLHLNKVWSVHRVPTAIDEVREDGALVAPLREVLHRSRPHTDVVAAVFGIVCVVRANDVGTQLPWVVRVLEDTRLTVWEMLPQGEIGVL